MESNLKKFNNSLENLDCTTNMIKSSSDLFIEIYTNHKDISKDMVKIIFNNTFKDVNNSLKFVYLINEITMKLFKIKTIKNEEKNIESEEINEIIEGLLTIIAVMCENYESDMSEKQKSEILRILNIWQEKSVYDKEKIIEIKVNLLKSLSTNIDSLSNKEFLTLYFKDCLKFPKELIDFSCEMNDDKFDVKSIKNIDALSKLHIDDYNSYIKMLKELDDLSNGIDEIISN